MILNTHPRLHDEFPFQVILTIKKKTKLHTGQQPRCHLRHSCLINILYSDTVLNRQWSKNLFTLIMYKCPPWQTVHQTTRWRSLEALSIKLSLKSRGGKEWEEGFVEFLLPTVVSLLCKQCKIELHRVKHSFFEIHILMRSSSEKKKKSKLR